MKAVVVNQVGKMYRAVWGEKQSVGKTLGEAIDALTTQLENGNKDNIYIVNSFQPDEFFLRHKKKVGSVNEKTASSRNRK